MEFLRVNEIERYITTITSVGVDSNTATVLNMFDRDIQSGWTSSGYTSNTKTTISFVFGTSTTIDRIILQNHNFKDFRIFYNGVTASTFTPDINITQNSSTSNYYSINSQAVNSIQIQIDACTTSVERYINEVIATTQLLNFERNPTAADYIPNIYRKQIRHEMPDGGISLYNIEDKFRAKLGWKYITESFKNSLQNIYDTQTSFLFVPFGTTTSWDGKCNKVVWSGIWDFKHADNNTNAGFSGHMTIEEVP